MAIKFTSANPFAIGWSRLAIAAFALAFLWRREIEWDAYKKKGFYKLVLLSLCFFLHWLTYTFSIKYSGPSITVLGMSSYGIQLLFLGSFFLKTKITMKSLFCLMLICIGVVLVVPSFDIKDNSTLGLVLAILSAGFYSMIPILLHKTKEFKTETRIFVQFFGAFIGYMFFIHKMEFESLKQIDWIVLACLGVFGTLIAHTLWSQVTAVISTSITAILYYLITPVTIVLSHLVFGEVLTTIQLLGASLILVASFINLVRIDKIYKILKIAK